jgi:hypothetical protein
MIAFQLVVTPDFWDRPRRWPAGCRPVVFSAALMMCGAGTVQVPAPYAGEVERMLREHPAVVSIARMVEPRAVEGTTEVRDAA